MFPSSLTLVQIQWHFSTWGTDRDLKWTWQLDVPSCLLVFLHEKKKITWIAVGLKKIQRGRLRENQVQLKGARPHLICRCKSKKYIMHICL